MDEKELKEVAEEQIVEPAKKDIKDDYKMPLPASEKEEPTDPSINRPAHWSMRIAAGVIDLCLIFLALFGLRYLLFLTPMGTTYNNLVNEAIKISDTYKLEKLVEGSDETFGYMLYEGEEKYEEHVKAGYLVYQDEDNKNYVVANHEEISKEVQQAFNKKVNGDQVFRGYRFDAQLLEFGVVSIAMTVGEGVFLLGIPLLNKRRASLGKLAAGTMVINNKFEVEAKWYQMLGRYFWILIVESLLPLLLISNVFITPLIVGSLLFVITLFNKKRRTLHDFISRTRVIDKRSFVRLEDQ